MCACSCSVSDPKCGQIARTVSFKQDSAIINVKIRTFTIYEMQSACNSGIVLSADFNSASGCTVGAPETNMIASVVSDEQNSIVIDGKVGKLDTTKPEDAAILCGICAGYARIPGTANFHRAGGRAVAG